jgi:stress-induced-phosphoprotein 1
MTAPSAEAIREKELGNEAYKVKDFAKAHQHYDNAMKLAPTDISFMTNKAAAYYEEGKYDECIELCQKAIEVGREHRAEYKLIAKAFARIGNAYLKKGNEGEAILYFDKSLSEFRDPAIVTKRGEVEKIFKEKQRLAYLNPEKAEEEKQKGNEFFKNGDFPSAIKHYSEAIRRAPDNATLYSNRAACYTKLLEFEMALTDCDMCVKKDPKFIKGYLRKGAVLTAMKEMGRAARAYEDALAIDPHNQEALAGYQAASMSSSADPETARRQALQDPEIQQILGDPAMRLILEQMSTDPKSIQEHLKNPAILQKLLKLRDAGIVQMR